MSLLQMAALGAAEKSASGIAARTRENAKKAFEKRMADLKHAQNVELEDKRFGNNVKVAGIENENALGRQKLNNEAADARQARQNEQADARLDKSNDYTLAQQDALLKKTKTQDDARFERDKVTDLYLDGEGDLSSEGKGAPQFQRKANGELVDLRPKSDQTLSKEQTEKFKLLLTEKYKHVQELQKLDPDGNADAINRMGQEIQMLEQILQSSMGIKKPEPKPFDPELAIKTMMNEQGGTREEAIRTLAEHPKLGAQFAEMAAKLPEPEPERDFFDEAADFLIRKPDNSQR